MNLRQFILQEIFRSLCGVHCDWAAARGSEKLIMLAGLGQKLNDCLVHSIALLSIERIGTQTCQNYRSNWLCQSAINTSFDGRSQ